MPDQCLFCIGDQKPDAQIAKVLPILTPVTPADFESLSKADFSKFPRYTNPNAPEDYGKPFSSLHEALNVWVEIFPILIAAVSVRVTKRVAPAWKIYMGGGSKSPIDLATFDPTFVDDFANDKATKRAMEIIHKATHLYFLQNANELPRFNETKDYDLTNIITDVLIAFGDSTNEDFKLDYFDFKSVPGNLVGSFGPPKDQTDNMFGHQPSTQNDCRDVDGIATISPYFPDGGNSTAQSRISYFKATYNVNFDIKDTIDFCPGGSGTSRIDKTESRRRSLWAEEDITVPLSRLEASRLTGDVPVKIKYTATSERIFDIQN